MPPVSEAAKLSDHETAEAIRDGELTSPQQYGDFWLFDLRITGTGAAYRDSIDEWAFRDPKKWLSQEFLDRCNGLLVVFGHPTRAGIDHEEFQQRAIGTIVLPYVKGEEVWGIAKVFDADAAAVMQTTHRSTSPGVTPPQGSQALDLEDGSKVLAEDLPLVLDHLAVCEAGVWDKDGPPDGIRLDSRKDRSVADEDLESVKKELQDAQARIDAFEKADKARKDAKDAEESDKEAIAAAEEAKADKAKKDAQDAKDRKDAARKDWEAKMDGESEEDYEKRQDSRMDGESDEDFEERKKDRKAKKDAAGAPKENVDADRGTELKDSKEFQAMAATIRRQGEQIASLTAQPSIEEANAIAKAWGRWDSLYQMLGEQTPQAYPGEKSRAYLRRLADGVRKHTQGFQNYVFHDAQQAVDFELVANAIFAEAMATAKNPTTGITAGFEREIVTHPNGKTRTDFIGDHKAPWLPFAHPTKFAITKINRPAGRVYSQTQ